MSRFDAHTYESLLARVEKPGRYLGNERGAVRKDPGAVAVRFALAFPEVYEIAQSHPGLQLLYDLLNRRDDVYAERVYAPWTDLEGLLREHGLPLVSLESFTPLREFHVVGFSLQYELTYTNVLMMLDRGGIPLRSEERLETDPLVVAGGPCVFNPEPLAEMIDAFLLGDGEEAVHEICDVYRDWDRRDRRELLERLARIDGIYVPAFYAPEYDERGALVAVRPLRADQPPVIEKRIVRDLNRVPLQERYVVPNMRVVHGRPSLEVMRGCVKGCRFCQAGYIYRPLRERDPHRVLDQAERAVQATGTDELSLLSLSTGDYSCVNPVLTELMNRYAADRVAVALPSTRVDALAPSLLEQIRRVRKTGFTLAPEAGSQRMRDIIQKEYQEDELIEAARQIFSLGWRALKLYFMIGLPGETEEDIRGIAELSARVKAAAPHRVDVTASVSTFVPKPHTPFQWAAQIDVEEVERRQRFLRRELQRRGIRFKWHDARESYLEGVISRGDRRTGRAIRRAYELGCRFDGWTEQCRLDRWQRAFTETGIDPEHALGRRLLDQPLPWDHISSGVTKKFLQRELALSVEGRLTPDCSVERCTYCGACDFKRIRNVDYHVRGAKGSEHRGEVIDNWAQITVQSGGEPGSWEPRGWHKIRQRAEQKRPRGRSAPVDSHRVEQALSAAAPLRLDAGERLDAGGDRARERDRGAGNAEEWLGAGEERLQVPAVEARPTRARVRITYRKLGRARFISHLELIDVFTTACRRAGLPIAFSQGHRPAPRFRFSPGLPVGCESDCETLDLDLTEDMSPERIASALAGELPEGMSVSGVERISRKSPAVETTLAGVTYRLDFRGLPGIHDGTVDRRIAAFLDRSSFPMRRRSKGGERTVDARPLVRRLERDGTDLWLELRFTSQGSIRPVELLGAVLEVEMEALRGIPIRKLACTHQEPSRHPALSAREPAANHPVTPA